MKKIRTVLVGLGAVNIGLLKILVEKHKLIQRNYGLDLTIVGVADSSGIAINKSGFTYEELIRLKFNGHKTNQLGGHVSGISTENITAHVDADLLVEGSPVNLETGNPGLQVVRAALMKGWSVVSANKAPLVLAFDELHTLANEHNAKLAYSATVCGGLPVINVLQRDLKVTSLVSLKGIFNATTNFILEELEKGRSFDGSVIEAQRIGAAEADPSLDIDGLDTANKLYIIMKSFTDFSGGVSDIEITGIRNIKISQIEQAASQNKRIKLLASASKMGDQWILAVEPIEVESDSFLGNCDGWEMGIQLQTDYYKDISMKIMEKEPVSTSAAVLRDIINVSLSK